MRIGIVGLGKTKFGKLFDSSNRELAADAFQTALTDLVRKNIAALVVCSGTHYDKLPDGSRLRPNSSRYAVKKSLDLVEVQVYPASVF
jgi:acetyl-CoA acetyltransferase